MLKNKFTDLEPSYIGKYRVIGKLGKGGMGDIYRAVQEPLNRIVALKVLPPQLSRDEEFAKRFEIEAKAISLMEHQNIVSIYEYGEEDGYRFIAMQFVDGMDLGCYINETRVIAVSEIIDFSKQICRGLRYAHSHNIIHRDIKPQNVLLDKSKVVHISDFGIAKIFSSADITMTGSAVGTPEYMSPEQAQGKKLDAQTDIYSLGILMYEMLTRKPPFTANNSMAVAYKQVHEQPMPPSVKRKDTPKRLELIILKALKKEKHDRYESVEELLEHLDSVDPTELVERTTVRFRAAPASPTSKATKQTDVNDRRITDRRQRFPSYDAPFFSLQYWYGMVRTQWLSWLAIAALAGAFLIHVKNQ
ncbi:MAG: protein kinase [Chitinispirillales bacterium]|jgi:serine/threonine-protein kinase|nr:protein kinase [Chitinispirillales bacterium]